MGYRNHEREYDPAYSKEDGLNHGLYYCPVCNQDTLHQILDVDYENYDIKCTHCGTTSMTRADYFDAYEEEALRWDAEINQFMGDDGIYPS